MKQRKIYLVIENSFFYKENEIVFQANRPRHVCENSNWVIGKDQYKAADLILKGNKRKDGTAIPKNKLVFIGYL